MNSTFARTEPSNSQRKRSVLSNGKSENGFVFHFLQSIFSSLVFLIQTM